MILFLTQVRRNEDREYFFRFMIAKWSDCDILLLDKEKEEDVIYMGLTSFLKYSFKNLALPNIMARLSIILLNKNENKH